MWFSVAQPLHWVPLLSVWFPLLTTDDQHQYGNPAMLRLFWVGTADAHLEHRLHLPHNSLLPAYPHVLLPWRHVCHHRDHLHCAVRVRVWLPRMQELLSLHAGVRQGQRNWRVAAGKQMASDGVRRWLATDLDPLVHPRARRKGKEQMLPCIHELCQPLNKKCSQICITISPLWLDRVCFCEFKSQNTFLIL